MPDEPAEFASPPCFMNELDETGMWAGGARKPAPDLDVARWRKAERERLLADRLRLSGARRAEKAQAIALNLDRRLGDLSGRVIGGYWPIRGEPNLLDWLDRAAARGATPALPVIVGKGRPLTFRAWRRGERLEPGVWRIPTPVAGAEVAPDIVLAPVVGFDAARWRLGYGGGYFDRTLAASFPRPFAIGVGYDEAAIPTIYPQPHDVPMDAIVTESAILG